MWRGSLQTIRPKRGVTFRKPKLAARSRERYWIAVARTNLYLYEGRAEEAYHGATAVWPTLRRSMLLRMEHVRVEFHSLRGRCALARARADEARREGLLREAQECAARLGRELPGRDWSPR